MLCTVRRQASYWTRPTRSSTRPVNAALMGDFFALMESGGEMSDFFKLLPAPEELQHDRWALATAAFCRPLDVIGYNYQPQRYEADGKKFPGRVLAGTETWGHMSYTFWTETARLPHVIGDFIWTAMDYLGEAGAGAVTYDGKPSFGAPYPFHTAGIGDFDLCGVKKPQSYYRE